MNKSLSYGQFSLKVWPHIEFCGPVDIYAIFFLLWSCQMLCWWCSLYFKHKIFPCRLLVLLPAKTSTTDILTLHFPHIHFFKPNKNSSPPLMTKMKALLCRRNHNFLLCMMEVSLFLGDLPTSPPASAEISLSQNHLPLITVVIP